MNHDIRSLLLQIVLVSGLDGGRNTLSHVCVLVNLLALNALALLVVFLFVLGATAFGFKILRSSVTGGVFVLDGDLLLSFYALHISITSLSNSLFFLLATNFDLLFGCTLIDIFSAVLGLVVLGLVSFGLVGRELGRSALLAVPLDTEAGDSGFLGEDYSSDLFDDWLGWGLSGKLLFSVFVVDVVADTDELATIV